MWRVVLRIGLTATLLLAACGTAPPTSLQQPDVAAEAIVLPTDAVPTIALPPSPSPASTAVSTTAPSPSPIPTADPPPPSSPAFPSPTPAAPILPPVDPLPPPDLGFDGARAMQHVEAQMQWVPRDTGAPGWRETGDYIVAEAQAAGWTVEEQRFDYQGVSVRNIIAKRGSGPLLILGAHYDARKYADQDPDPAKQRDPVPAANDGASGVAALLELARHIDADRLGRTVWLAFFDAEDNGDLEGWEWTVGSTYMAQNLPTKAEAMVLLDMIGDADLQIYYEQNSTPGLRESIWQSAAELGYVQFIATPKFAMLDDHTPFLAQGIPAADLIDFDYPHWHTTADTTDKVSAASLEAVGRTIERWLETRAQP
jgi:hypothetical protein